MEDPVCVALDHVRRLSPVGMDAIRYSVTLNFHPDMEVEGRNAVDLMAQQASYCSQFETGTSSGGLTAYRGGDRWEWESRIFGKAYDDADPSLRPKYGAINHRRDPVGGARRFGSCHLRLAAGVRCRTTFCYPDSHMEPRDFAVGNVGQLVASAQANERGLDPWLDNYVEAHVHGRLRTNEDAEAVVLDPSFRGTSIERAASSLGCDVEWHDGFRLHLQQLPECALFRGPAAAEAIARIAEDGIVTPHILGRARYHALDYQTAKWVWHCMARFGHP